MDQWIHLVDALHYYVESKIEKKLVLVSCGVPNDGIFKEGRNKSWIVFLHSVITL